MANSVVIFIPHSKDEQLFIETLVSVPDINYVPSEGKYPFYALYWDKHNLYLRKRRDLSHGWRYKRMNHEDVAALSLLPKEALKAFFVSL